MEASISLRALVMPLVKQGKSNPEIVASHPDRNPHSLMTTATLCRRELGITVSRNYRLPDDVKERLDDEARRRSAHSGTTLMHQILGIIVRDDLFDQLLGAREKRAGNCN